MVVFPSSSFSYFSTGSPFSVTGSASTLSLFLFFSFLRKSRPPNVQPFLSRIFLWYKKVSLRAFLCLSIFRGEWDSQGKPVESEIMLKLEISFFFQTTTICKRMHNLLYGFCTTYKHLIADGFVSMSHFVAFST